MMKVLENLVNLFIEEIKIYSSPLPHRAPHNRTAPQLREFYVVKGNVLAQIPLDVLATMCTVPGMCTAKPFLALLPHAFQILLVS